jgi:tripartite-type tricarboxylate transporter receptor subunit TctC
MNLIGSIHCAIATCLVAVGLCNAQSFPARPIRLIVPFPPGGSFDAIARPVGERMGSLLGQPLVIENRAGASGNIGAAAVARTAADGYTLLLGNDFLSLNAALGTATTYNPLKDLAPIGLLATVQTVLAINPVIPAHDFSELAALSRTKPLNYGSPAPGSVGHLLGEKMNLEGTMKMVHIPYKGTGPAVTDTIGGFIDGVITPLPGVASIIRAGKLRGIGVFGTRRAEGMPELPTVAEGGGPPDTGDVWYGLFAPVGTADPVIRRLNQASADALRQPELLDALRKAGFEPGSSTPGALGSRLKDDIEKWGRLAKAVRIDLK